MTDVFISYSRKDIACARLLHEALVENGLETRIDWQNIPPSAEKNSGWGMLRDSILRNQVE